MVKQKDINLVKFGLKVKELRQELKLSQEDLAFEAELDRTYIGGIERGERNVSLVNLIRIARSLKTSASQLLENIE